MESTEVAAVSLTWIGAVLFVWGVTMGFDVLGLGTRSRNISMRYYDRNTMHGAMSGILASSASATGP